MWATKRGVSSAAHGYLSSYTYAISVIHYLIAGARPPLLVDLQDPRQRFWHNFRRKGLAGGGEDMRRIKTRRSVCREGSMSTFRVNPITPGYSCIRKPSVSHQ